MATINSDNRPAWYGAVKAVFDGYDVPEAVWVPLVYAESRGNPSAVNDTRGQETRPGTRPEYSIGLFQINVASLGLDPNEVEAYAQRLTDPVFNASFHAPKIAAAWNAVKAEALSKPESLWAGLVSIRSGHPGGHANSPCTTPYCQEAQKSYINAGAAWANNALRWAAAAFGGGGGNGGGGNIAGGDDAGGRDITIPVPGGSIGVNIPDLIPDWLKTTPYIFSKEGGTRALAGLAGFIIFTVAALALLFENKTVRGVAEAGTKAVVKAVI